MKVLVACEESQAVTIELRKLGHEAYSCDIEPCSGGHPEWHLRQDVIPLLRQKWDMIIAFPPCTFLSNAGACRLYPQKGVLNQERYEKGLKAKDFFMMFYNADCPKIAIENPVSSRIYDMPPWDQEIHPWQFGHPYTKKTRLWIKGLPPLISTEIVDNPTPFKVSNKCCNYCKKQLAHSVQKSFNMVITGERRDEGGMRSVPRKDNTSMCFSETADGKYRLRPLFYVSDADKQWYKDYYNIRYSDAYEVYGLTRTGCCGCSISAKAAEDLEKIRPFEPNLVKAAWNLFGDSYRYRKQYNTYKAFRMSWDRLSQPDK